MAPGGIDCCGFMRLSPLFDHHGSASLVVFSIVENCCAALVSLSALSGGVNAMIVVI
jgi:hypothetical protein